MRKLKLYVIKWGDAWGTTNHYDEQGDLSPMIMTDVGWVCEENAETIVLCRSRSETGRCRDLVIIPWYNIIDMEELI